MLIAVADASNHGNSCAGAGGSAAAAVWMVLILTPAKVSPQSYQSRCWFNFPWMTAAAVVMMVMVVRVLMLWMWCGNNVGAVFRKWLVGSQVVVVSNGLRCINHNTRGTDIDLVFYFYVLTQRFLIITNCSLMFIRIKIKFIFE